MNRYVFWPYKGHILYSKIYGYVTNNGRTSYEVFNTLTKQFDMIEKSAVILLEGSKK